MKQLSSLLLLFFLPGLTAQTQAQATWAADVAPILYDHCVSCHRTGGVGAFPLLSWSDATLHATSIRNAVQTRYMPPWRALPSYRHFKDENYLSDAEIQTIAAWVNGGQLPGDLSQAPPLPNFHTGSQLTAVDMELSTPQFTVTQNSDLYRAFAIPTGVTTDKFFNEIEIIPGNDAIIHHIVLYSDPTNAPLLRDQADPGPGFTTNGMVGNITPQAELIGEWTPGGTPIKLPPQFGYRIPANGYFIFEIHFAPGHINQTDPGSIINLKLTNNPSRELYYGALVAADTTFGLLNPPFKIPANTEHTLIGELKMTDLAPVALSVFSLTPHAHVVCKSFKAFSYVPGATDTIPLIDVPKWDFHWQSTYTLRKPLKLGANRRNRAVVVYDNTVNNPENPHFPPQDVWWGEKTSDEMLYLFATVAVWQPGDENLVLDSTLLVGTPSVLAQDKNFTIAPNPVTDVLTVRATTPVHHDVEFLLNDMNGTLQRHWHVQELIQTSMPVGDLASGMYLLQIRQEGRVGTYKVLKQ